MSVWKALLDCPSRQREQSAPRSLISHPASALVRIRSGNPGISPSEEPVRVLSITEIKHLLELAQGELEATLKVGKTKMSVIKVHPGELVPWFVLGLFGGLRPEETLRLDWADIDFDRRQIDLGKES
jgi:integrase